MRCTSQVGSPRWAATCVGTPSRTARCSSRSAARAGRRSTCRATASAPRSSSATPFGRPTCAPGPSPRGPSATARSPLATSRPACSVPEAPEERRAPAARRGRGPAGASGAAGRDRAHRRAGEDGPDGPTGPAGPTEGVTSNGASISPPLGAADRATATRTVTTTRPGRLFVSRFIPSSTVTCDTGMWRVHLALDGTRVPGTVTPTYANASTVQNLTLQGVTAAVVPAGAHTVAVMVDCVENVDLSTVVLGRRGHRPRARWLSAKAGIEPRRRGEFPGDHGSPEGAPPQ